MGHTPGPWRSTHYNAVLKSCNFFAIEAEDHTGMIAEVDDDTKDAEANARLIAQSPALLKAINRLADAALARESVMGDPCGLLAAQEELRAATREAREVIAKAEGREA